MKINRETFLNDLQMVRAGLAAKDNVAQSSHVVFKDGDIFTYNDEVACRKPLTYLNIAGAIPAAPLMAILEKIDDTDLDVADDDATIIFRGKGKTFSLVKDAEIELPINQVEKPEKWKKLPEDFPEALELVARCVSTDETRFELTCIRVTPEFMEACDNLQALRFQMPTPIKAAMLIRGDAIKYISALGMTGMSVTPAWVHFRNKKGLVYSIRRHAEEDGERKFPDISELFDFKGQSIVIPKGVKGVTERANIFAMEKGAGDPALLVQLKPGRIRIAGQGLIGKYGEWKKAAYSGPELEFLISPEVLAHVSDKYQNAKVDGSKLRAKGPKWAYATVLGLPKKAKG